MDIKTAKQIYSLLNPKSLLTNEEQILFDEAESVLDEANLIGADGEIFDE